MASRKNAAAAAQWNATKIVQTPICALAAYVANARTHSPEQVAQIAASIREFGFVNPVLIDENGEIIAGHGRLLAARALGLATIPTIVRAGLSEAQKRGLRLADNKIALNSGWDDALLGAELAALAEMDFSIDLTGFSALEIGQFTQPIDDAPSAGTDRDGDDPADQEVEPPRQRVARRGDVWLLGEHRLMCGDSTSAADVATLIAGEPVALLFTSPPYGQQRKYTTGGIGDWDVLMQGVFAASAAAVAPAGQILVNLGLVHRDSEWQPYWQNWIEWMRAQGWRRFGWYVWDQGPGLPGDWNGRMGPCFEFIFHFNREQRRPHKITPNKFGGGERGGGAGMRDADGDVGGWTGDGSIAAMRIPDALIRVSRASTNSIQGGQGHPAVFPVRLPEFVMLSYTDSGDLVLEPFSGSGTTILAAQRAGRRARAMEIAGEYVDIAIARWQSLHPDIPVLLDGGGTWHEEAAARGAPAAA